MAPLMELRERANAAGIQFVKIELAIAISFLQVARNSPPSRKVSLFRNAERAVHTAVKVFPRLLLDPEERKEIGKIVVQLSEALRQVGATVWR
jgi:hypothetical protein